MAITRLYHCKDFEIKSERLGSRLKYKPEYIYKVIYKGADETHYKDMRVCFGNKKDAQQYISKVVKRLNAILKKAHNEGIIRLESLR